MLTQVCSQPPLFSAHSLMSAKANAIVLFVNLAFVYLDHGQIHLFTMCARQCARGNLCSCVLVNVRARVRKRVCVCVCDTVCACVNA